MASRQTTGKYNASPSVRLSVVLPDPGGPLTTTSDGIDMSHSGASGRNGRRAFADERGRLPRLGVGGPSLGQSRLEPLDTTALSGEPILALRRGPGATAPCRRGALDPFRFSG